MTDDLQPDHKVKRPDLDAMEKAADEDLPSGWSTIKELIAYARHLEKELQEAQARVHLRFRGTPGAGGTESQ